MIVEFFGPPSAGKTTLALALADELRRRGHTVTQHLSLRPAEQPPKRFHGEIRSQSPLGAVISRLGRPFGQFLRTASGLSRGEVRVFGEFLGTLPPRNPLWTLRLGQYLMRLGAEWSAAARTEDVALFDQAYVQFICSLAMHSADCDAKSLAHLLSISPAPDMLILVDAPNSTLKQRLHERLRGQSFFERLLEFDMKVNLASTNVIRDVADMLIQQGRSFTRVSSADPAAARHSVDSIVSRLPHPSSPRTAQTYSASVTAGD
jgi:thymidylate kinase